MKDDLDKITDISAYVGLLATRARRRRGPCDG